MYSKKVMEHFRNPRNMGEMKDPDAVGEVGNPTCLLPKEKIHKNSEAVDISKLEKNQKILTHTGTYEKINSVYSRVYKGKILTLKNKLGKVNLTPEHLVCAIKIPKHYKFFMNKYKRTLVPSWYHADQLEKGDIVLYPILKGERNRDYIEIDIPKSKWDFNSKEIPKKIPINSDLLRLFGYFLSEGNIQEKLCRTFISFTLNYKEKEIVEDIKKVSKNVFGLNIKVRELPKRKTTVVCIYNARLARFFKKLFGNGAEKKKLPEFIMHLPREKQKYLLYALWKGDGYVNLDRVGPRAGYATISYQLAQQIKKLLLRQKIGPSIYVDREKEIKGVKHREAYRIHIGQRDSLKRLCNILKIKYEPRNYEAIKSWFDENYFYIPITKKEVSNYKGRVYNLEVEKSHSFVSEAFCLHNCGDILKLYIKVGKKEGKEYIKDIKFLTMGCAAAIATSSMITELAKGKTLDEAMKITRDDVADALEGLPPIKMHCSNLAADALHKAIKNYRDKE